MSERLLGVLLGLLRECGVAAHASAQPIAPDALCSHVPLEISGRSQWLCLALEPGLATKLHAHLTGSASATLSPAELSELCAEWCNLLAGRWVEAEGGADSAFGVPLAGEPPQPGVELARAMVGSIFGAALARLHLA